MQHEKTNILSHLDYNFHYLTCSATYLMHAENGASSGTLMLNKKKGRLKQLISKKSSKTT